VRTYFFNPFPPDSAAHFLGNYVYAFFKLHLPFLSFQTASEAILFLNELAYGFIAFFGLRAGRGSVKLLCLLFLAHVATLTLFEADFGSYFRHFSSVVLYLLPAFALFEERECLRKTAGCDHIWPEEGPRIER
jgi:hypothetical protein